MPHLKQIGRLILVLAACALIITGAAILFLSTDFAHRYVLGMITQRLQDATGGRVEIGNFSFHRANLGADFHGIKLRGTEADPQMPLLSADRMSIDLGLHLLHTRKIDLEDVVVDHPVIHLSVDANGKSNMPPSPSSTSGGSSNVFEMAIGHFALNGGEIFYNDRHATITADVRNLDSQVAYSVLNKAYD